MGGRDERLYQRVLSDPTVISTPGAGNPLRTCDFFAIHTAAAVTELSGIVSESCVKEEVMDSARDKVSGDIIDAEFLWLLPEVQKDRYECHGCGAQVWPASFEKGVNKKRPYFSLRTGEHIEPCGIDGEEALITRARHARVGSPEGFPVPFPNKLILTDERPVVGAADQVPTIHSQSRTASRSQPGTSGALYHGHTVKTLRPICRTYLRYPHDHAHLPLSMPDCGGNTFASIFRRLGKLTPYRDKTNLYFAPLQWVAPDVCEGYAEWKLDAGEWDDDANRRGRCYRVRVTWSDWTPRQRDTLRHEVEVARQEVRGVPGVTKAWLFFVGMQDAEDPALILVNRYQLICCIVGELLTAGPNRTY